MCRRTRAASVWRFRSGSEMFLAPESRRVNRARIAIRNRAGAIRRSFGSTHRARRRSRLYSGLRELIFVDLSTFHVLTGHFPMHARYISVPHVANDVAPESHIPFCRRIGLPHLNRTRAKTAYGARLWHDSGASIALRNRARVVDICDYAVQKWMVIWVRFTPTSYKTIVVLTTEIISTYVQRWNCNSTRDMSHYHSCHVLQKAGSEQWCLRPSPVIFVSDAHPTLFQSKFYQQSGVFTIQCNYHIKLDADIAKQPQVR